MKKMMGMILGAILLFGLSACENSDPKTPLGGVIDRSQQS